MNEEKPEAIPNVFTVSGISVLKQPERSDWKCYMWGGTFMVMTPLKGEEPNWVWRKMHFLFFGNRWVKRDVEERGSS